MVNLSFQQHINHMGKNTEIKFVGQPIFKQILGLLDVINLQSIIKRNESDKYYNVYSSRTQLVTMLFGILSRCDSMGEICDGMRAMSGIVESFGPFSITAKSTACDGCATGLISSLRTCILVWSRPTIVFLSDSRTSVSRSRRFF
jgi:hypothetical protein